jgi:outer membrane protein assembly factor BamA
MILCAILCLLAWPCSTFAAENVAQAEVPRSLRQGYGLSYWGEIPEPADSVAVTLRGPARPLWEKALKVPYEIISLPVTAVRTTGKASLIFAERTGLAGRIQWLLGPQRGPFGMKLQFQSSELIGLGYGIGINHDAFLGSNNRFVFRWSTSTKATRKINTGVHFGESGPNSLILGASSTRRPNARYFGDGPLSREPDESFYTQDLTWAGLTLQRRFLPGLNLQATVLYSGIEATVPEELDDDDRPIDDVFDPIPVGYGKSSCGVTAGLTLIRDTTDENGRPTTGGIRRLRATYFSEMGEVGESFWTWRAELEEFIPLWKSKQVLALRGVLTQIETSSKEKIPFQRMITNDDPDQLRGYDDFRWRGLGLALLTAEYRWPIWANTTADALGADCYLFADYGQVFNHLGEVSASDLTRSYGAGVRLIGNGGFSARAEIGKSKEETVARFSLDQVFQYAKGGLMHGKDQVAVR